METELLAKLIDARRTILVQLRQLADRQAELVRGGEMTRLLSLLAVKQRLLNDLQKLERELDPFRAQDPDQRIWRSAQDRQRCREAAEHCEVLLGDIVRLERACESELVQRRDQVAVALQGTHSAARATEAYLTPADMSGSHFDASCET